MTVASATRAARFRIVTLGSLMTIGLALGAAGCSRSLDMEALDQSIISGVNDQLGLPIASVECPVGDRALQAGDTFRPRPRTGARPPSK